jgi:hypothetical protein
LLIEFKFGWEKHCYNTKMDAKGTVVNIEV